MRQIKFLICLIFLGSACSVSRIQEKKFHTTSEYSEKAKVFQDIAKQNLTTNSFFIQKAEFKVIVQGETKNGFGSIKFEKPDKYLISLKSLGGIEVARIFLSNDTILVNDKINRKLYYGSPDYLKSKFRITPSVLPMLLGDFINDEVYNNKINCIEGKLSFEGIINRLKVSYVIDCEVRKIILALPENNLSEEKLQIRYSDFIKVRDAFTPAKIEISESRSKNSIEIKIDKIESPWEGKIQFIPGNKYEKIHLL